MSDITRLQCFRHPKKWRCEIRCGTWLALLIEFFQAQGIQQTQQTQQTLQFCISYDPITARVWSYLIHSSRVFPQNWTSKSGDISVSSSLSCEAGASGVSPSRPSGEKNWININQSQPGWINQTILEMLQTYLSTSPGLNFEPTKRAPNYLITYQVKPYRILNFPWPSSSFLDLFRSKAVVSLLGKPSKFPICSRLICCPWKIRESPAVLLPWTCRDATIWCNS